MDMIEREELIRLRKEKFDKDYQRVQMHLDLFCALENKGINYLNLAEKVLKRWEIESSCGLYFINRWNGLIVDAKNNNGKMSLVFPSDTKISLGLAAMSPFLHGFLEERNSDDERFSVWKILKEMVEE